MIVEYSAHGCLRSYLMKNHSGFVCLVCTTIVCSCSVCDHGVCANGCFLCVQLLCAAAVYVIMESVPMDVFCVYNYWCRCCVCDHGVCAYGCFLCVQLLVQVLCM